MKIYLLTEDDGDGYHMDLSVRGAFSTNEKAEAYRDEHYPLGDIEEWELDDPAVGHDYLPAAAPCLKRIGPATDLGNFPSHCSVGEIIYGDEGRTYTAGDRLFCGDPVKIVDGVVYRAVKPVP